MKDKSIISFFWGHIKPYKWLYIIMLSAPIIGAFYPFAYNYAIKLFLDAMVENDSITYQTVLFPIALFIVAHLSLDIAWRISNIAEWKAEPYVRRSILLASYDYVQHHSYKFFQDNFTGTISSKIKGILDGYDRFWEQMHHGILHRLFKITVNIFALFIININIGLFQLAWGLVYIPTIYMLSKRLNTLTYKESESRHSIIGQISDRITNIISLFSYASRKRELNNLDQQISSDFLPKQIKVYKYNFIMQIIGGAMYIVMFIFILFYMLHLKMAGLVSVGDFAFVFGIALVVAEDIWHTTTSLQDFSRAMGDFKSALTILNTPQENVDLPDAKPLILKTPDIEFKNVDFTYSEKNIVFEKLNLFVNAGEKIGLVGHSGAGKSSLVSLLLKYFNPTAGEINIDKQNINHVTQDSLREKIAVIPQDTMLFHRTLMENIRYGNPSATNDEVIEASKKAHIHDFIMTLPEKYNTHVGERGIKLSGGQRQRVSIARAILKDAPILILDEATSSLDSHTESLIQESLNFFIGDKKKTVIAIAHRLSTLKHLDRILVLDNGKIIQEGTHDQLINDPKSLYKQLWDYQEL